MLEANEGREVDVVLEMAGGQLFDIALRAMADMGRLVVYGISSREQNEVRTGRLLKRSQSIIGFWLFHYLDQREHLEEPLAELFALAARRRRPGRRGRDLWVERGAPRPRGAAVAHDARQAPARPVALSGAACDVSGISCAMSDASCVRDRRSSLR